MSKKTTAPGSKRRSGAHSRPVKSESIFRRQGSQAFLESIIQNIPSMIFMKDAKDLKFLIFNRAAEQLLGLKAADLLGKGDHDFFPKEQADFFKQKDREVLAGGKLVDIANETIKTADGKTRHLHTKKIPLAGPDGEMQYLLGISEDVTDQLQQARELEEARDRAEASGRAKSEFLANMSHEIRTPMNGILGMSELLLDTKLDEQQRDYALTILRSSETLLTIINDVLDFSKIEARKLDLTMATFSMPDLLEQVIATLSVSIAEKSLQVSTALDPQLPAMLSGDAVRMRQVLLNLLSNAVKFTPPLGRISIEVKLKEALRGGKLLVECAVADTGPGISQEHLAKIFDPFYQVDSSLTRVHGGTGLGLSIAAQLVKLMGGELVCQSSMQRGSTFHFAVPLDTQAMPLRTEEAEEVDPAAVKLHVLVAEDNAVNQKLTKALLEKDGYQVTIAGTGPEAIEQHGTGKFDLILMDIQMPELDGVQATAAIRAREQQTGQHTPIIALTAHAMHGDREKYLAAGMDGYLAKPIRRKQLRALIKFFSAPA
ncbi:MAG: response regulator [Deltaproteobacteria bacterium]|nr:response regulator [Deltaproteobacteria bacterium]